VFCFFENWKGSKMREHQVEATEHPQDAERRLRVDAFTELMHHWQRCDDRQRRTWLAWFTGQLPVESLKAMKIRLSKKEAK
jgi:hypothetical protein